MIWRWEEEVRLPARSLAEGAVSMKVRSLEKEAVSMVARLLARNRAVRVVVKVDMIADRGARLEVAGMRLQEEKRMTRKRNGIVKCGTFDWSLAEDMTKSRQKNKQSQGGKEIRHADGLFF